MSTTSTPWLEHAVGEGGDERRPGRAHVAADEDLVGAGVAGERDAERAGDLGVELVGHRAADVVGLDDLVEHGHDGRVRLVGGPPAPSRPVGDRSLGSSSLGDGGGRRRCRTGRRRRRSAADVERIAVGGADRRRRAADGSSAGRRRRRRRGAGGRRSRASPRIREERPAAAMPSQREERRRTRSDVLRSYVQPNVAARVGTTTIRFGAMRYGPSAPCDRPVREVADTLTSTGTPTWSTWNDSVLLADLDVADRRPPAASTGSIGCSRHDDVDLLAAGVGVVGGAVRVGHQPALVDVDVDALPARRDRRRPGIAAHSSRCWNQLVPSSRLRSRWSPARPVDDDRLHGRAATTMSESATWKISHGPLVAEQRQLGLRLGLGAWPRRCAPSRSARRAPAGTARRSAASLLS